jgi:hypothetical protein
MVNGEEDVQGFHDVKAAFLEKQFKILFRNTDTDGGGMLELCNILWTHILERAWIHVADLNRTLKILIK